LETLRKYVEEVIGMPLSLLLPKDKKLFPLDNADPDKAYLFGSKEAKQRTYRIQANILPFIQECPEGYFLLGGPWGYGINSYALYYSRVDFWSKIFFRLPIGGCYMNDEREGKRIREFLTSYFEFEKHIRGNAKLFIAVDSMWSGEYRILFNNGNAFELGETLLAKPDFNLIIKKGKAINGKNILL